jgi:hypothetical protein
VSDNVSITAGSGTTIAADDVSGVLHQRVKVVWGADGVATDVAAGANALPIADGGNSITVDADSLPLPTGAATDAKLPAFGTAGTASADVITVQGIASMTAVKVSSTAAPPSRASSNGTPISTTTTDVIPAPSAGNHLRIVRAHISNGGATATWVGLRDGAAGTQHYRTYLVQGATMSLNLNQSGPLDLTTATRLDLVLSAAGSVEYEIDHLVVSD